MPLLKECKSLVILCIYKGINTMRKNENIIIRVDERLKDKFQQLTESNNMTMSAVLNACIFDMVRRNLIPMNIRSRVIISLADCTQKRDKLFNCQIDM